MPGGSSVASIKIQGPARSDFLLLPKALIELYQPYLGAIALGLYLNLKCLWESRARGEPNCSLEELAGVMQVDVASLQEALLLLSTFKLVELEEDGKLTLEDPLGPEEFPFLLAQLGLDGAASAQVATSGAGEETNSRSEALNRQTQQDLYALFDFYQKQIGLLGPVQEDKLRYWVCTQGMDVEVIVQAIGEMRKSTNSRRIEYLEGILRNWYNEGIRTLADLIRKRREWEAEKAAKEQRRRSSRRQGESPPTELAFLKQLNLKPLAGGESGYGGSGKPHPPPGIPNAGAYKQVDAALVRRWKEMFQDE